MISHLISWITSHVAFISLIALSSLIYVHSSSLSGRDIPQTYADWLLKSGSGYEQLVFLGKEDEVAVHWKIEEERIGLAVGVSATGWVGFGLSESGGMKGADMFLYTVHDAALVDAYSTNYSKPLEDMCQDWKLEGSYFNELDGFLLVEVSRALKTLDQQDIDIYDDSGVSMPGHRLIAAWGDSTNVSYHGENVGMKVVRLFSSTTPEMSPSKTRLHENESDGTKKRQPKSIVNEFYIELRASNFTIPTNMTTYAPICFEADELLELGLNLTSEIHMIGAHYLNGENEEFVHHIVLYGLEEGDTCLDAYKPVWVWAPGSEEFKLPENVGLPFGPESMVGFRMEIHYNNPSEVPDKINNSGVNLTFTPNLREHNAAPLILGDPLVSLHGVPIGSDWSKWEFNCPRACTDTYLSGEITVFTSMLHMHETGERMAFKQYRDGQEIQNMFVDYYDFEQVGLYHVPSEPFIVKQGDSFDVICYYNEGEKADNRTFGLASYEEMCMAFLWYFPRNDKFPGICGAEIDRFLPGCGGNYSYTQLDSESEIGRTFGTSSKTCDLKVESQNESPPSSSLDLRNSKHALISILSLTLALAL